MRIIPKEISDRISIKNIKENFGHDLGGFFCDIYLDKKKVAYLNVDGWGGCPDVKFYGKKDSEQNFINVINELKLAQLQADDYNKSNTEEVPTRDWKADDFSFETQIHFLCERLNFLKGVEKYQKQCIVYGNPHSGVITTQKLNIPIDEINKSRGRGFLPNYIKDNILPTLQPDEFILNTNVDEIV